MPTGNAEKNNAIGNVRFFDLADAYRKKQSKKTGNNIQEKQTDKSSKEVMKKEPQEQEIIKPSKKQAESAKADCNYDFEEDEELLKRLYGLK